MDACLDARKHLPGNPSRTEDGPGRAFGDLDAFKAIQSGSFKHDPAGNGECASCHAAHQSNQKGLLIKERAKLCFECHEEKDMAAVKGHAGQLQKSCLECHDPHLGADKFLLKTAGTAGGGK